MMWYVFKSVIFLSAMYVPYLLMLRRESFFRFNRSVLLGIMVLSLALPFVTVQLPEGMPEPVGAVLLPAHEVMAGTAVQAQTEAQGQAVNWQELLMALYLVGLLAALLYKGVQLVALHRRIRSRVLWKEEREGATIYCHADDAAPYSWMRSIVISQRDYEEHPREILLHEMGHVRCGHSWDVLLLNVVQAVQWFNPLAWLMGSSLRDVHEYEADDAVLRQGVAARHYQLLLVCKAVANSEYTFANGFNHSLLTKRIKKMVQKKSNPWLRLKVLAVMAIAAIGVFAFAEPKAVVTESVVQSAVQTVVQDDKVCENPDEIASFKEGDIWQWLARNIKYPEKAQSYGVKKRANVQFVVKADGSIGDVKVLNAAGKEEEVSGVVVVGYGNGNEQEKIAEVRKQQLEGEKAIDEECIRVVKAMPKWNPGKKDGKPVDTKYNLPIMFRLN